MTKVFVKNQSEVDTLKHLENFEATEFDGKGNDSDHSEYQDSSSVEDELEYRLKQSSYDAMDVNQQGLKVKLSSKVQDVFRRSSVFHHSMRSAEEEAKNTPIPEGEPTKAFWDNLKERVEKIGVDEEDDEEPEEVEVEQQFRQVNFKKLLKKERVKGF